MDAKRHLRTFIKDKHKEQFIVMFLSSSNKHSTIEVVYEGSITSSVVYPRENDKRITERIMETCKLIDVQVYDHIS